LRLLGRRQPEITPAQAQTIEVVEGEFKEVIAEVQKPQPLAARISGKLIAAKSVLDSVGGTIKSLAALGAAIPMLIEAGKKLFGG